MFQLTTESSPVDVECAAERFTLHMTPLTSQEIAAARRRGDPPQDPDARAAYMADLFPAALESCRAHVTGWEGIGDEAGEPLAFSAERLEALLADPMRVWAVYSAWLAACNRAAVGNSEP